MSIKAFRIHFSRIDNNKQEIIIQAHKWRDVYASERLESIRNLSRVTFGMRWLFDFPIIVAPLRAKIRETKWFLNPETRFPPFEIIKYDWSARERERERFLISISNRSIVLALVRRFINLSSPNFLFFFSLLQLRRSKHC